MQDTAEKGKVTLPPHGTVMEGVGEILPGPSWGLVYAQKHVA